MAPLALDPEQTFVIELESDKRKPRASRPRFVFRYLSDRDWKKLAKVCDELQDLQEQGVEAMLGEMEAVLGLALSSWENMIDPKTGKEIAFDPKQLEAIVNPSEISELLFGVMEHVSLDVETRKKSASQSRSSTGKSAKAARRRKRA